MKYAEKIVIKLHNVSYNYHGEGENTAHTTINTGNTVNTIEGIDFSISRGEFVLIAGASASGKTTVSKCINGLIPYFHEGTLKGDIFIHGRNTKDMELHEIGTHIASVFQDPRSQFFTTNTTDEVSFGCQNMGLPKEEIRKRVENAFFHLDIKTLAARDIFKLSNGEKQKIAIASSYAMNPDIYLFDEPSANLDITSTVQLARIMKQLKEDRKTIIVIEHRLYYLRDLIDRVIYMADGTISELWTKNDIALFNAEALSKRGLRQFDLSKVQCRSVAAQCGIISAIKNAKTDFTAEGLMFAYKKNNFKRINSFLKNIHFSAASGEIIGIVGRNGAGKTTLTKLCCGLLKEKAGYIKLNGKILSHKKRLGKIYMVMQDSDYQLFSDSVIGELTLGISAKNMHKEQCEKTLESVGLLQFKDYHPAALSRGQKQRLTIAAAITSGAHVIFLDEPTSGLDGTAMKQVAAVIASLAEKGCIIFVITHDYEFLLESATRILHLAHGTIADDFLLHETTVNTLKNILFTNEELCTNDR